MYLPTFTITNKMLAAIGRIEAAKEVIENAPLIPAWEGQLRKEAVVRTVHHGTHIEGNRLNLEEAGKVMEIVDQGMQITSAEHAAHQSGVVARDRDIQEVLNYRRVLTFIEKFQVRAKYKDNFLPDVWDESDDKVIAIANGSITADVVLHVHRLIVDKLLQSTEAGHFRKIQVVVKNSKTGEITFRPPAAIEVPFLVKAFVQWLNKTDKDILHPVLKAGVTHYELVRIHPFVDGNGRVSRAIATLSLFLDGYDIKKFFALEEYYDKNALAYYQNLQDVEKKQGNLTGWLEYFAEGIAIELARVKEKVKSLSRDIRLKQELGGRQVALTERQLKVLEYIQKIGFIQSKSFFEVLPMVSDDTVLRDLNDLVEKGIIIKEGKTKGARYVLRK